MKRSRLRAKPENVRAWKNRAREKQIERARAVLARGNWRETNPPRRRDRVLGLRGFTQRVFTLYGRKCVVCRGRATQAHHVIPVRTLFAQGRDVAEQLAGDARNGVPICARDHERHEKAFRRIRRDEIPPPAILWANDNGFGWLIDDQRIYPTGQPA